MKTLQDKVKICMLCKAKNVMLANRCIYCGGKLYVEGVIKTK